MSCDGCKHFDLSPDKSDPEGKLGFCFFTQDTNGVTIEDRDHHDAPVVLRAKGCGYHTNEVGA